MAFVPPPPSRARRRKAVEGEPGDARTSTGHFRPANRGDLQQALTSKDALQKIAPESPRPAEMLKDVQVHEEDGKRLTAHDAALHELLISHAYGTDRSMPDVMHEMPISDAVRYLGSHTRVERSDVWASLRRLKSTTVSYTMAGGRQYAHVSLLEWWSETAPGEDEVIKYKLPDPLRDLLATQRRYAYLELSALPLMSSKYSIRLYKRLVLEASAKKWDFDSDNTIRLSPTPHEFASWIGFPVDANGRVKVGKLRERVLSKIADDFRTVQAFTVSLTPRQGFGRGAPLAAIDIEIQLRAPSRHRVAGFFKPSADTVRVSFADTEQYRIESRTVRRARKTFGRHLIYSSPAQFSMLWHVALHEAISREPLTAGYYTREARGERLLSLIDRVGADDAAWIFFEEEARDHDLRALTLGENISTDVYRQFYEREKQAHKARWERLNEVKKAKKSKRADAPKAAVRPTPPAPAQQPPAPAPVADSTGAPAPAPAPVSPDLETCNTIRILLHSDTSEQRIGEIGHWIKKRASKFTGERPITVVLDWQTGDHWRLGDLKISDSDLDAIRHVFMHDIVDELFEIQPPAPIQSPAATPAPELVPFEECQIVRLVLEDDALEFKLNDLKHAFDLNKNSFKGNRPRGIILERDGADFWRIGAYRIEESDIEKVRQEASRWKHYETKFVRVEYTK